ncbi:DUF2855 family protein [Sphingosinicella soli]|uniref:DUF2855 domain-containing protein n=1 Tax=Sphingosinicella soli TaxID=333708 RepID=A0A7W7B3S6_9SPHN|nr:DUF2855 family protein [Sphingosinicella soli]MBB4633491.1 hypothetical protein [Sphingosinicella soli]
MTETVFGERMLIAHGDIAATGRDSAALPAPDEGDVLFAVRRIALTANNVTYAAAGEMMGYWRFFPGPEGKGILPVWGFAEAVESRAEGIAAGDRFYGYWPLATHLLVRAPEPNAQGFTDTAAHRQGLSDVYNRYQPAPEHSADDEAIEALFRPLFMTGWLIDRFLDAAEDFGAAQVILSSASSKTAQAAAFNLTRRQGRQPAVVGLTSAANRAFVESLGSYDRVLTYDAVDSIETCPSVYVDFAGDSALTAKVHTHLGDALKHSAIVGMTHWSEAGGGTAMPGPTPTLFFAPTAAEATVAALGPAGFAEANGKAWAAFVPHVRGKLALETRRGIAEAEAAYRSLAAGRIGGAAGIVVELD